MAKVVIYVSKCDICDAGFLSFEPKNDHTIQVGRGAREYFDRHKLTREGVVRVEPADLRKLTIADRKDIITKAALEMTPYAKFDPKEAFAGIKDILRDGRSAD